MSSYCITIPSSTSCFVRSQKPDAWNTQQTPHRRNFHETCLNHKEALVKRALLVLCVDLFLKLVSGITIVVLVEQFATEYLPNALMREGPRFIASTCGSALLFRTIWSVYLLFLSSSLLLFPSSSLPLFLSSSLPPFRPSSCPLLPPPAGRVACRRQMAGWVACRRQMAG